MTRDEAIQMVRAAPPSMYRVDELECYRKDFVDSLVALGVLKLDEPLTKDQRVARILDECQGYGLSWFLEKLDAARLKIVEKFPHDI